MDADTQKAQLEFIRQTNETVQLTRVATRKRKMWLIVGMSLPAPLTPDETIEQRACRWAQKPEGTPVRTHIRYEWESRWERVKRWFSGAPRPVSQREIREGVFEDDVIYAVWNGKEGIDILEEPKW